MPHDDGGPAFGHGNPTDGGERGMSLRDYFAAKAMPALIRIGTHPVNQGDALTEKGRMTIGGGTDAKGRAVRPEPFDWPDMPYYFGDADQGAFKSLAEDAYSIADAMLAARKDATHAE